MEGIGEVHNRKRKSDYLLDGDGDAYADSATNGVDDQAKADGLSVALKLPNEEALLEVLHLDPSPRPHDI
jgi:hypothetical protein